MLDQDASTPISLGEASRFGVRLKLDEHLPETLDPGKGTILVVSGTCRHGNGPVLGLDVRVNGGDVQTKEMMSLPPPEDAGDEGHGYEFWAEISVTGAVGLLLEVTLVVLLDTHTLNIELGIVKIAEQHWPVVTQGMQTAPENEPLVAICMATYNPSRAAFQRQVDSIKHQSHGNWICLISDDNSRPVALKTIHDVCAGDPRFVVIEQTENQGFYKNFETTLRYVPVHAQYVALADQDDFWYAEKLITLIEQFEDDTMLVYSDMRIKNGINDEVISDTYWQQRRNNYQDLLIVLLANTITGAASVFRRRLLYDLLPFPKRVGDAFHDHWIGCLALSVGRIKYVDRPLYDYYQYDDSVIGRCDFELLSLKQRAAIVLQWSKSLLSLKKMRQSLLRTWFSSLAVYKYECRRLRLICNTINCRSTVKGKNEVDALSIFTQSGAGPAVRLLAAHIKILKKRETTDDAELRLAAGYLAWAVNGIRERKRIRHQAKTKSVKQPWQE